MITELVTGAVAAAAATGITYNVCLKKNKVKEVNVTKEKKTEENQVKENEPEEVVPGYTEEQIKELEKNAYYDMVTGLMNMTKFSMECDRFINTMPGAFFGIIVFEVENLDRIRLLYGLAECDKVRKYIADSLNEILNYAYIYGRVHEDLFAVFACYDEEDELPNIVSLLTENIHSYAKNVNLTLHFGIYNMDDNIIPTSQAIYMAELAKRTVAKNNSGENYAFFTEALEERLVEDNQMSEEMNNALDRKQFVMYMQPMVNLRTHEIIGAEALVRWEHPTKGVLSPFRFLPLFEANNFIIKMDHYIWREAFKTIRHWIDNKIDPIPISINISPIHFEHPRFIETLCNYAEQFRIPKNMIELEIPERIFADATENIDRILKELHEEGFILCIDNFGSYHSPINALKEAPVSVIKLDRKFLNNNLSTTEGLTLVRYLYAMAKELGMQIVAEGVENIEQANDLNELGCDYAQGFFFAKPMTLRDFDAFHKEIIKNKYMPAVVYPSFDDVNKDLLP